MKRKLSWDKKAVIYFSRSISYIRREPPQQAEKIKQEILQKIDEFPENPELYLIDKYKQSNYGDYRYFEMYRYRISYRIKEQEIIVVRVRHTGQEPKDY